MNSLRHCARVIFGILTLVISISGVLHAQAPRPTELPPGVYKALAPDEAAYCDQFLGSLKKGCHRDFRAALVWTEIKISPHQNATLIELHNVMGQCGSAGCTVYIFARQPDGSLGQILGKQGEVGSIGRFSVLSTMTLGHFDVQKIWSDGKTREIYRWNGQRYSSSERRD